MLMTQKIITAFAVGLLASTLTAGELVKLEGHPDSSQWPELFKADLSNAIDEKKVWSVNDGVFTASADHSLWTDKDYKKCILDLEFKTAPGTNSGVIVYCRDMKNWIPNSVEVQIADDFAAKWAKSPKTWQCAAIFGHLAASEKRVKKPGEWNRMTIACEGPHVRVVLNDKLVTNMDMRLWKSAKKNPDGSEIPPWLSTPFAELPNQGRIGLQGKHAGAPIFYRNIKIKVLE